jgi:hypothetical protein
VSIETANGVDYPEGMSDQDIPRYRAQAGNRQSEQSAHSTRRRGCGLRASG